MSGHLRVAVYPEAACERMRPNQLSESIDFLTPDIVIATAPYHHSLLRRSTEYDVPVITPANQTGAWVHNDADPLLVAIGSTQDISTLADLEATGKLNPDTETFLLSDLLTVDINLTDLTTTLDGQADYEAALKSNDIAGSYTHLTTNAPPDYRNDWGDLTVQGAVPGADGTGIKKTTTITLLTLHRTGLVSSRDIDAGKFGLEALDEIGPNRADTLRDAGFTSREDVANTPLHKLQTMDGFGRKTAQKIRASATALEDGDVHRTSDATIPRADPVFIDIETDGLSPTIVWLIGVLDSSSDRYLTFTTRDPDAKGKAVENFMMWYTANASNRPIVAYHGQGFDFPVLKGHIQRHCPEYVDAWENAWKFDPYWWAVKNNNAILPGRTNKLEDVAEGLGWETDDTGLTGGAVAHVMQRWLANPCEETEPDWEKHEKYCEDDVRSMAYVFDAIKDADRLDGIVTTDDDTERDDENVQTAQGTLSDF